MRCVVPDDPVSEFLQDPEIAEARFLDEDQKVLQDLILFSVLNSSRIDFNHIDQLFHCREHKKQPDAAKTEASALKQAVRSIRRTSADSGSAAEKRKLDKTTKQILDGKRILDLAAARLLAPLAANVYETIDGRRISVFYGNRMISTSSTIHIGKDLATHNCLTSAWRIEEAEPNGTKCPYDLTKIKLHRQVA